MRARLDSEAGRLELELGDATRMAGFLDGLRQRQGFVARLAEPQKLWTELTVVVTAGTGRLCFPARVVQVFARDSRGYETALQVDDVEALELTGQEGAGETRPDAPSEDETAGASPAFRIRQLNVGQRSRLAARAGRTERQILLRDNSPRVLTALLANPRLEEKEVLELVKSPFAVGGVLQRVAAESRWSGSYDIRLALVRNPKTPTPLAVKLLPTLRRGDLSVIAKSAQVREAVRAPALRLYLKQL